MSNNILWLVSWYPSELSPYDGDFIQRHARAVSLHNNITIIFIRKDENGFVTKNKKTVVKETRNLAEIIIYYHSLKTGISIIDRLLSRIKHNRIYKKALRSYVAENGPPELLHIHVALHVIRPALWLKRKYGMPLIISEHWTGYLKDAKPNLENYHPLYKSWLRQIFNKAGAVTVVSRVLGEAIKERFDIPQYQVIPNVVDTNIFFPIERTVSPVNRFVHVSLLNFQKDPEAIIEAFALVKGKGLDFVVSVYGPANNELLHLVKNKDLERQIIFKGEVPQNILAKDMQQADALVLYSRYETFGCVVIEANACGIPAILSDLPVFREYIIGNKTGVFAKANDPVSLAETIIKFIQDKDLFRQEEIAGHTKNTFGYDVIGKQFDELYKTLLSKP